jgi:hypothetical protein
MWEGNLFSMISPQAIAAFANAPTGHEAPVGRGKWDDERYPIYLFEHFNASHDAILNAAPTRHS